MANNKVRLPYQIIFLPNLILCSSLYLFFVVSFVILKKRYKPMVDYGVKKTSKGVKKRTDEDQTGKQTRDRRRSDGEKNMDDNIVHI